MVFHSRSLVYYAFIFSLETAKLRVHVSVPHLLLNDHIPFRVFFMRELYHTQYLSLFIRPNQRHLYSSTLIFRSLVMPVSFLISFKYHLTSLIILSFVLIVLTILYSNTGTLTLLLC